MVQLTIPELIENHVTNVNSSAVEKQAEEQHLAMN